MDKIELIQKELNGAFYDIIQYRKATEASVCIGNERVIVRGFVALKTVTKRYKFPDQLVLTMISNKQEAVTRELRNPSDWNTVEFYVPLKDAEALLERALEVVRSKLQSKA